MKFLLLQTGRIFCLKQALLSQIILAFEEYKDYFNKGAAQSVEFNGGGITEPEIRWKMEVLAAISINLLS